MKTRHLCTWTVAAALTLGSMSGAAHAAPGAGAQDSRTPSGQPATPIGSWDVTFETVNQGGPFKGLLTFTSDGTITGAEPVPFETAAFGTWLRTGPRTAAYTFRSYLGSAAGENTGSVKVVGKLRLNGTEHWTGPFSVEIFDPSGVLVFADAGTFIADRIGVEQLSD